MKLPKIKVVKNYPIYKWQIFIKIGKHKHGASYSRDYNTIYLTTCFRWAIIHELLHWWAYQNIRKRNWLNEWLDKPESGRRINIIGF